MSNPSLSAQNLLGLRDAPRQFFLQVYHVLGSLGDTRYLLALFPPPWKQASPAFRTPPFPSAPGPWGQHRWEPVRIPGSLGGQDRLRQSRLPGPGRGPCARGRVGSLLWAT